MFLLCDRLVGGAGEKEKKLGTSRGIFFDFLILNPPVGIHKKAQEHREAEELGHIRGLKNSKWGVSYFELLKTGNGMSHEKAQKAQNDGERGWMAPAIRSPSG